MKKNGIIYFSCLLLLFELSGCSLFTPKAAILSEKNRKTDQTEIPIGTNTIQIVLKPTENIVQTPFAATDFPSVPEKSAPKNPTLPASIQASPSITPTKTAENRSSPQYSSTATPIVIPDLTVTLQPTTIPLRLIATAAPLKVQRDHSKAFLITLSIPSVTLSPTYTKTLEITHTLLPTYSPISATATRHFPTATKVIEPTETLTATRTASAVLQKTMTLFLSPTVAATETAFPTTTKSIVKPTGTPIPVIFITPIITCENNGTCEKKSITPTEISDFELIHFSELDNSVVISGKIKSETEKTYTFIANKDQVLRISSDSSSLPKFNLILQNNIGTNIEPQLSTNEMFFDLNENGWYNLKITALDQDLDYNLALSLPERLSFQKNQSVIELSDQLHASSARCFTIEIPAGKYLMLSLKILNGEPVDFHIYDLSSGKENSLNVNRALAWQSGKDGHKFLIEMKSESATVDYELSLESVQPESL